MFTVVCTIIFLYTKRTLYIMYLYDLFHILLSFLQTYGSRECVYIYVCVCVCVCMYLLTLIFFFADTTLFHIQINFTPHLNLYCC